MRATLSQLVSFCSAAVLCSAALLGSAGCNSPEYPIVGSLLAPGAIGDVQVEKADHGQRLLTVVVDEIPAPSKINAEAQVYVLWTASAGEEQSVLQNHGECKYDAKKRQAKGALTTGEHNFRLLISAEANKDAAAPSEYIIAERRIK